MLTNHEDWPKVRHYIKHMLRKGWTVHDADGADITDLVVEMTGKTEEPPFAATSAEHEAERILMDGWDAAINEYNDYRRVCRRRGIQPVSIQKWSAIFLRAESSGKDRQ